MLSAGTSVKSMVQAVAVAEGMVKGVDVDEAMGRRRGWGADLRAASYQEPIY